MDREKKVIISVIAVLLIIAIIGVTLLVINNNANEFKLIGEKFSDNYYDNGWSKEVVAEIKNDIPIPTGFSCEKEIDDDTIIIKDEQGNEYLWVPYDENIDPAPYEEEVAKYYGDSGIKASSIKNIDSMKNYGGFYIGITKNKEDIIDVKVSEEEYEQKKEEIEGSSEDNIAVSSTLLGYDELVTFLHYKNTLDSELGLQLTDKSYELATTDSTEITTDEEEETTTESTDSTETSEEETTTESEKIGDTTITGDATVVVEEEDTLTEWNPASDEEIGREQLDDDELISVSEAREELQDYYLNGRQDNIHNLNNIESKVIVKDDWEEYVSEVIITDVIENSSDGDFVGARVVPIPNGFSYHSGLNVGDGKTVNNGISIVDNNNENLVYVWIPVEGDFEQVREDLRDEYNEYYGDSSVTDIFDNLEEELPDELIQSISEYGGFYMSEAELGYDDNGELYNRQRGMEKDENGDWYVNIGDYYRKVEDSNKKSGITYTDEMLNLTYDNAVSISSDVYDEDDDEYGVVSHLTYGAEWDAAMLYLLAFGDVGAGSESRANRTYILDNSSAIGKYGNSEENDNGYFNVKKINGLWGLAGNLSEITQEKINGNIVIRGGSYASLGNDQPMASRDEATDNNVNTGDIGFRTCLYIKPTGMADSGDIYDEIDKIDNDDIIDEVTTLIEYTSSDDEDDIIDTMNVILELSRDEVGRSDSDYIDLKAVFDTISSESTVEDMVDLIEYYQEDIVDYLKLIFGSTAEDDDIYDEIALIDNSTIRTYVKNLVGYSTNTTESTIRTTINNILNKARSAYSSTDTEEEYIELRNLLNDILDQSTVSKMISEIDNNQDDVVQYLQEIFGTTDDENEDIYDEIDYIDNSTVRSYMNKLVGYTSSTSKSTITSTINNILNKAKDTVSTSNSYYRKLNSAFNTIKNESTSSKMVDAIEEYQYEIVDYLIEIFGEIDDGYDDIYDEIAEIDNSSARSYVKTLIGYSSSTSKSKITSTMDNILDIAFDEVGEDDSYYIDLEDMFYNIENQSTVSRMISRIETYQYDIVECLQEIFGTTNNDEYAIDDINNSTVQTYVTRLVNYTDNSSSTSINSTINNILSKARSEVGTSNTYYKDLKDLLDEITDQSTVSRKIDKIEENAEEIIEYLIEIFGSSTDEDIYDSIEKINNDEVKDDIEELIEYTSSTNKSTIDNKLEDILSVAKDQVEGSNITTSYYNDLEEIFNDIMNESTASRKISMIKSRRTEIVRYLIRIFSYDELYADIWLINNGKVQDYVENLVEYTSSSSKTTINSTISKILSEVNSVVGKDDSNYIALKELLDEITNLSTSADKVSKIEEKINSIIDYLITIFETNTTEEIYFMIDKINEDVVEGDVVELIAYTTSTNAEVINDKSKNILSAAENKVVEGDSNYSYLKGIIDDIIGSEVSSKIEIIDSMKERIVITLIKIFNDDKLYIKIGAINDEMIQIYLGYLTSYTSSASPTQINTTIDNILSEATKKVGNEDSNYLALEKILNEIRNVSNSESKVTMISNNANTIVDYLINIYGSNLPELIVEKE